MVRPLIPDRTLKQLQGIAERSHKSTARIGHKVRTPNSKGGSTLGPETWRGPYPCRLDASGLSGGERVRGEQLTSVAYSVVALPLSVEPPESTDRIEVTTVLPDGVTTVTEVFNVVGDPFATSYAVELQIPVTKVGT